MSERTDQLLDEVVRLMALQARQGMETQNEAILTFLNIGLEPTRVAELVGTTPATVNSAKQKAKKKAKTAGTGT
ncbi:MAG: hypothetical protein M3198_10625 [Actinomycetota bacterium]|nr:hypothetical protein [Actinomycetota bacterium]